MTLVYDVEIIKAVPSRDLVKHPLVEGVDYCDGWGDKENMGVAVICAYDALESRYRVFTDGNFDEFEELATQRRVAGFNSIEFDDVVCGHAGIKVTTNYDLLQELWVAAGLGRAYEHPTHAGFGLDATAKANGMSGKTGYGGTAPIDWQQGKFGKVIDYCLEDVRLTWRLICRAAEMPLNDPRQEMSGVLNVAPINTPACE